MWALPTAYFLSQVRVYRSFSLSFFLSTDNCVDVEIVRISLEVRQVYISAIGTSRERLVWFYLLSCWCTIHGSNIPRGWLEKLKFLCCLTKSDWRKKTKFKFRTSSLFSSSRINSTWTLLIRWRSAFKRDMLARASPWVMTTTLAKSSHCQHGESAFYHTGIYSRIDDRAPPFVNSMISFDPPAQ